MILILCVWVYDFRKRACLEFLPCSLLSLAFASSMRPSFISLISEEWTVYQQHLERTAVPKSIRHRFSTTIDNILLMVLSQVFTMQPRLTSNLRFLLSLSYASDYSCVTLYRWVIFKSSHKRKTAADETSSFISFRSWLSSVCFILRSHVIRIL